MTVSDSAQGRVFLISLIVGVLCVVLFDVFYVIRHRTKNNKLIVNALDFLYLIIAFLLVFVTGVKVNFGAVRYYQLIGIAIGVVVYHKLFSKIERFLLGKILDFSIVLICFIAKLIYKPIMLVMRLLATFAKLFEDKTIKTMTTLKKIRKKRALKREKNKKTVKKRLKMM